MGAHWRENRSMISEIRNDSHGTVRGTGRPGPAARARLACLALPCVAAMAAMSPMAAQAQTPHISNAVERTGNFFVDGPTQGTASSESTFHLAQPFTTPAGSGNIPLRNVVLHFTTMPLGLNNVKLYLYRGKANPNPTNPPGFAPTVPDSGTVHAITNEPALAGRLAEFATPRFVGNRRYRFDAPANTVLDASTTYHLYLWSVANRTGPKWRAVDITRTTGGTSGDVGFTGHTDQCGDWAFLRGLSADVRNPGAEGWIPDGNGRNTFVTEIVGERNHLPTRGVTITGSQTIGETLTADTATIADPNGGASSFTYEWLRTDHDGRNSELISGATSRTYTPTEDDEGRRLRVQVAYTDDDCYGQTTADSTDNTFATGLTLGGTAQVGQTLTAVTDDIKDTDGLPSSPSFTYQWTRVDADGVSNPEDIAGAMSRTYTPVGDDQGKRVRVTVRFADRDGNREVVGALSGTIAEAPVVVVFDRASVNGRVLTVTMNEALDEASVPAASAFAVSGGRTVSAVTVSGSAVTLTLTSSVGADETVTVSYAVPGSGSVLQDEEGNAAAAFSGRPVANETPTVTLVLTPASIGEDGETSTVTATLDKPSPQATTLTVTAAPVSPAVANDYTLSGSQLTIAANSLTSTGSVTITANDNDMDAPDKTVTVSGTATNDQGVTGPDDATLTITDDDDLPVVTVASGGDVTEGEDATFTLTRSGTDVSGTLVVTFAVTGGDSVLAGVPPTSATFGASSTTATVAIPTTDDQTDEPDATLTLTLTDGDAYDLGTPAQAEAGVSDNEATPALSVADASAPESDDLVFPVTLNPASWQAISVDYAITPVSAQAADYTGATSGTVTFQPGETSANITLDLVDDDIEEEKETVEITLSNPQPSSAASLADDTATGTIEASDTPLTEGEDATSAVGGPSGTLVVTFAVTGGGSVLAGVPPT